MSGLVWSSLVALGYFCWAIVAFTSWWLQKPLSALAGVSLAVLCLLVGIEKALEGVKAFLLREGGSRP